MKIKRTASGKIKIPYSTDMVTGLEYEEACDFLHKLENQKIKSIAFSITCGPSQKTWTINARFVAASNEFLDNPDKFYID